MSAIKPFLTLTEAEEKGFASVAPWRKLWSNMATNHQDKTVGVSALKVMCHSERTRDKFYKTSDRLQALTFGSAILRDLAEAGGSGEKRKEREVSSSDSEPDDTQGPETSSSDSAS